MHLIYIILYICIRNLNNNKNQPIMTTIATILFVTAMTLVFTGFFKLLKFIK